MFSQQQSCIVDNDNCMGVAEDWDQTNTTTSVNLSESKTIIFPSICLPVFKDSEVKNPDLA